MPFLKKIRKVIKCHMAALPIPFRTTKNQPTFFNLDDNNGCTCPAPHGRTFPTALDSMYCNRYEIRKFAEEAHALGINYLGVCCGAAPIHIREVAEAIGRKVPASRDTVKKWIIILCMVQTREYQIILKDMETKHSLIFFNAFQGFC